MRAAFPRPDKQWKTHHGQFLVTTSAVGNNERWRWGGKVLEQESSFFRLPIQRLTLLDNIAIFPIMFFLPCEKLKIERFAQFYGLLILTSWFSHIMIISRLFCPILPKWMDCRMRLWLARRYHPRTVARCYQQGPTKCYQPTPRTGTMSLQIFLNSLTLFPQQCERWDSSLNTTFVGMKRKALASLFIGHTLLCWLAEWLKQTQYQTAHWK